MRYDWNLEKSSLNFRRRGVDFEHAIEVLGGPFIAQQDTRRDYGEIRFVAVGSVDGVHFTVVYTDRMDEQGGVVRRIISLRLSNRKERMRYEEFIASQTATGQS